MRFDPKPTKYPFPKHTDKHYLVVKKNDGTVFDKDYPYIDRSKAMRFKMFLMRVLLRLVAFPIMTVRLGLKIVGRDKLKKNADLLRGGVISCANHVHLWDYLAVMKAIRPRRSYILAWAKNMRGENKDLIRLNGGIPVPEGDTHATFAFINAIKGALNGGEWLHIYAEGSMWEYYAPIRPFKGGIGYFSAATGKPVLPMAFSYREPGFIRKKIFGQTALFTLAIGDPIMPDESLPRKERENDVVRRAHEAVCRLSGVEPKDNIYPPIYNDSERIDYYPLPLAEKEEEKISI
ncbi:MAG: 1-acyl-sn-glycerol-3-phosphate acyltransferase [Clostridia bacterium]|nr:1-acyl-sn-glycerol-3-phosphate acyltransferase [Clostridia bacterium]